MRRRWWILPLIVLAAFGATAFVRAWKTDRQVMRVVDAFGRALRIGDPHAATELLLPEFVDGALDSAVAHDEAWRPSPDLKYRVQRLKVVGDDATVDLWMSDGPLQIRPSLKLRRNAAGAWRIARIDGLPKPSQEEERLAADERERDERSQRMTIELRQAIRPVPGGLVDRPDDSDGPR